MDDGGTGKPNQMIVALKLLGAIAVMALCVWLIINAAGKA
jgi:hypothetical protein